MKLQTLIKNGKFNYVNTDITAKNFPAPKKLGKVELINFKRNISSEEAIKEMDKKGMRPANLYELLVFAEKEWNGKDWVVALGSVWRGPYGDRYVPYLYWRDERFLSLRWYDGDWDDYWRFLAVRKSVGRLDKEHKCEYREKLEKIKEITNEQ